MLEDGGQLIFERRGNSPLYPIFTALKHGALTPFQMQTIKELIKSIFSIRPVALTSSADGTGIDRLGFDDAMFMLEVGAVSGTSPTLDVKIQESADNSTFTDISGATFTQITAADKSATLRVNLAGKKRYLRAVATIAGTSPSFTGGVQAVLSKATTQPVSNEAA